MHDITQLSVLERRLFEQDIIPFRELITATNIKKIDDVFIFKEVEMAEDTNHNVSMVKMKTGEFKFENKVYPVDHLVIDSRSISFTIFAESDIASKFYLEVARFLDEFSTQGKFKEDSYIVKTTQTTSSATLDFNFNALISEKFSNFLSDDITKICASAVDNKAKVEIIPKSFAFSVNYSDLDKSLVDKKVGISWKQLVIEPRMGTNINDRVYYISTPTDSITHKLLIGKLENIFKKNRL